jgi:AAA domain
VTCSELVALPLDYVERIERILRPLGYEPEPENPKANGHATGQDGDTPFQRANDAALANLSAWVPDLGLYNCVRQRGRYESYVAVASFRESGSGKPLEQRKQNLKITSKGITDFAAGKGYSPIDLVMVTRRLSLGEALDWLRERVQPPGPEVDFEALKSSNGAGADAENAGSGSSHDDQHQPPKYRFKLTQYWEMRPSVERPYLIDELIPTKGIVVMWGPPKCLKSFIMLDMMFHVAKGWEYHDRAVQQGTVVYCAFEGGHGYMKRIEAQRRHYGIADDDRVPMPVMSGMANLISDHKLLATEIAAQLGDVRPAAVVLDTLNKSLVGSESKDTDMANYIRAAEAIREAFHCVVIIVHHCGWDESRMRGHSSLPGALDAELAVVREGDVATVTVEHMRDGAEGTQITFKSKVINVGEDANGRELTSLVVDHYDGNGSAGAPRRDWPPSLKVFRAALIDALLGFGFDYKIENGPTVKAVDLRKVRDAFYKTYAVSSEDGSTAEQLRDSKKKAFARSLEKAQALQLIAARAETQRQIIWLASPLDGSHAL